MLLVLISLILSRVVEGQGLAGQGLPQDRYRVQLSLAGDLKVLKSPVCSFYIGDFVHQPLWISTLTTGTAMQYFEEEE